MHDYGFARSQEPSDYDALRVSIATAGLPSPVGFHYVAGEITVQFYSPLSAAEVAILEPIVSDAPSVPSVQLKRLQLLYLNATDYISSHYSEGAQRTLSALWTEGVNKGWTQRCALVQSVLDWVKACLIHLYVKKSEIVNAVSVEAAESVTWNFAQFDAADPLVSVQTVAETAS